MASDLQISCIHKTDRANPHERIRVVGGVDANWTHWKLTVADAIAEIKAGTRTFYTMVGGRRADVVVARTAEGHEYLKTEADGVHPNNLLALRECPY